jgi:hypothetical protein
MLFISSDVPAVFFRPLSTCLARNAVLHHKGLSSSGADFANISRVQSIIAKVQRGQLGSMAGGQPERTGVLPNRAWIIYH